MPSLFLIGRKYGKGGGGWTSPPIWFGGFLFSPALTDGASSFVLSKLFPCVVLVLVRLHPCGAEPVCSVDTPQPVCDASFHWGKTLLVGWTPPTPGSEHANHPARGGGGVGHRRATS